MNIATEIIIRWYFSQVDPEYEHLDGLIEALKKGHSLNQADSLIMRDELLASASATKADGQWKPIIESAFSLHFEIEALGSAAAGLAKLERIDEALRSMPDNSLAKRITHSKIRGILNH